jgi:hypothetical protein
MKFEISGERTTRTVYFNLKDAPPTLHRPYNWVEDKERCFQPEHAVIKVVDGEKLSITVAGPMILKGGNLSDSQRGKSHYGWREMDPRHTDTAPPWMHELWSQVSSAPIGTLGGGVTRA